MHSNEKISNNSEKENVPHDFPQTIRSQSRSKFLLEVKLLLVRFVSSQRVKKNFFLNFWLRWVFVAAHGLSLVVVSRVYSSLWCVASHGGGFSYCGPRAIGTWASVVVAHGL